MARPTMREDGIGHLPQPGRITREKDGTISEATLGRIHRQLELLTQAVNGGLRFVANQNLGRVGNFKAQMLEFTANAADTEFSVPHSLGTVPLGYIPVLVDKDATLYVSNFGGWSKDTVYFKSSAAGALFNVYLLA